MVKQSETNITMNITPDKMIQSSNVLYDFNGYNISNETNYM